MLEIWECGLPTSAAYTRVFTVNYFNKHHKVSPHTLTMLNFNFPCDKENVHFMLRVSLKYN